MDRKVRIRWMIGLSLGLGIFLATASHATEPGASEASVVEFRGGHGPTKGFLARSVGEGPFPAIVVHEGWWLSDWVKENARRLAGQG